MNRIPEALLVQLKRDISLERLVTAHGIALARHGKDLLGRCPFHDDRTPSLVISPDTNLWHCLGACQQGGSVIDWVMKAEGLSFRAAVEYLRRGGTPSTDLTKQAPPKRATTAKHPKLVSHEVSDVELFGEVVQHYHEELLTSADAREYLASRGLWDEEAIRHFKLGYANRTLGYRLPDKNRVEGHALRTQLQRLGLYRESGHEHLVGCITVPLFHEAEPQMYGRRVGKVDGGGPKHLYLPGPRLSVWNAPHLEHDVILCESLFDALTFWAAGYRSVTCAYGVEGFGEPHFAAFRAAGVKTVRIAYDRDDAGDAAAAKLAPLLEAAGIETYRVLFPRHMDANVYACKVQPAKESLGLVLRKAEWLGKGRAPPSSEPAATATMLEPLATAEKAPAATATKEKSEAAPLKEESEVPEAQGAVSLAPVEALLAAETTPQAAEVPAAAAEPEHVAARDELVFRFGPREWRARGLSKNTSFSSLRINLSVRLGSDSSGSGGSNSSNSNSSPGRFFVDTLDLYAARPRAAFVTQAVAELEVEESVVKRDLGAVLLGLERAQETRLESLLKPQEHTSSMAEDARSAALALLRDPHLLDRIVEDLSACGLVGEDENKLVAYLAATSRLLERPLAVIIQSTSAAGKSSLMDAVLSLIPEESRVSFSAMTGQSLFYMGQDDLKHKVLSVSEEEGAERASYALKLLQSEGSISIASTGKDPVSGKHVTHTYRVNGPVQLFQTTTAVEMDEELLNRCLVLTVDEGRAQTRAILAQQREAETLEGLLVKEKRKALRELHQNAQRLLRPLAVVNPLARELSFSDARTRMRRDHGKYLGLIRTVALLHQHQREVKRAETEGRVVEYVEVTQADIEVAGRLAEAVLSRSLDELPPQTRMVLGMLEARVAERAEAQRMQREEVRFTQREARGWTGLSATQMRRHLQRLESLELLFAVRGKKTWEYVLDVLPYDAIAPHRSPLAPWVGGSDVLEEKPIDRPIAPLFPERKYPVAVNGASYP